MPEDRVSSSAKAIAEDPPPERRSLWSRAQAALRRFTKEEPGFTRRVVDEGNVIGWEHWSDDARQLLRQMFRSAAERREREVQLVDLALAIAQTEWMAGLVGEASAATLSARIRDRIVTPPVPATSAPVCTSALTSVLEASRLFALMSKRDVRVGDLLVYLLKRSDELRVLLADAGVREPEVVTYASHGVPRLAHPCDSPPEGDSLSVKIHNDDFTIQELVQLILTEACGLDPSEATRVLREAHEVGQAAVVTLPRDQALATAASAYERARAHGAPLKVTLERPSA